MMEASGCFPMGLGAKRIMQIQKVYPNLMGLAKKDPKELQEMIEEVPTFQSTTAKMFVDGIYKFAKFLDAHGIKVKNPEKIKKASSKLDGLKVCWTGYRNKDEEETVVKNGGEVSGFSSSTSVLIYSPTGKQSSKVDTAKQKGIPAMTWEQFRKKYL